MFAVFISSKTKIPIMHDPFALLAHAVMDWFKLPLTALRILTVYNAHLTIFEGFMASAWGGPP